MLESDDVAASRRAKMERVRPLLRQDMPHVWRNGRVDFLTDALRAETGIIDTANVSSLGYDAETLALIEKHRDGLVLDCGAGSKSHYYQNVVNLEIVEYSSTDVLGVAERLPFRDDSFDAVLSIAVLEHVRDPFRCAEEIARVLKPGGDLLSAVPFLAPVHGYPHHYFNSTPQGHARLFEDKLIDVELGMPAACHPIHCLNWMLTSWARALDPEIREEFLGMRVADFQGSGWEMLGQPFVWSLPRDAQFELASGTVLTAKKPVGRMGRQPRARRTGLLKRSGDAIEAAFGLQARLVLGSLVRRALDRAKLAR